MYREEIYYNADYAEIKKLRERVKQLSLEYKFYESFKDNIEISIGELFTNIIKHGQKTVKNNREIKSIIVINDKGFEITFEYEGEIPSEERINEVNRIKEIFDIEELSESGRGIYIIKRLMDEVRFEKHGDLSRAIMIKYLENF